MRHRASNQPRSHQRDTILPLPTTLSAGGHAEGLRRVGRERCGRQFFHRAVCVAVCRRASRFTALPWPAVLNSSWTPPACRAYIRQMKTPVATLGQLPQEPVPPDLKDELLKRFARMGPPEQQ